MILAAAGDLDPDEFLREVERRFAGLPTGEYGTPRDPPRSSPQLRLVKRELEQVHLCAAFEGIPLVSEDRYALHLLNTVLGGGMSSRLFQSIREERGLAYSVYSYHSSFADSGIETIYCGTSRGNFYVSRDGGATWEKLPFVGKYVYAVAIDPRQPGVVYATAWHHGVFRSEDGGQSWRRLGGANFGWPHRIIPDPSDEGRTYLTTFGGSVWHGPKIGTPGAGPDVVDLPKVVAVRP